MGGFQNSAAPLMEQLIFFHDHAMLILILITTLVGYFMGSLLFNKFVNRYLLGSNDRDCLNCISCAYSNCAGSSFFTITLLDRRGQRTIVNVKGGVTSDIEATNTRTLLTSNSTLTWFLLMPLTTIVSDYLKWTIESFFLI